MGLARELARLRPNTSGQLPTANIQDSAITDAKIAAVAASKLSGQVPDANAPSGSVIQVVSTQITSPVTVSTPTIFTYYDIPSFTITITPSSASNKILIVTMISVASSSTSGDRTYIRLLRNSTPIAIGDPLSNLVQTSAEFWNSDGTNVVNQNIKWLDSPSTTSAVTYKFQCCTNTNGGTSVFNRSRDTNLSQHQTQATQILALEIAA